MTRTQTTNGAETMKVQMQIEQTEKGWVMWGNPSPEETGAWFERWFATEEKAMKHAAKKGWVVSHAKQNA